MERSDGDSTPRTTPGAPDVGTTTGLTVRLPRQRLPAPPAPAQHGRDLARLDKVVVIGLGSVGLPLAVRAAESGYHVVGHETDRRRLQALAVRRSYVEQVRDARLRELSPATFRATSDESALAEFDLAVIVLPPSPGEQGPDPSYAVTAAATVARYLLPGRAVCLQPSAQPQATEDLVARILEAGSGLTPGIDFHLGSAAAGGSARTTPVGRAAVAAFHARLLEGGNSTGRDVGPPS